MTVSNQDEVITDARSDVQAFAMIYDFYFHRVYNYVRYRVRNADTTNELASRIFERVLTKMWSYKTERGSFSSWLFTIAHNIVMDYFREQKRCPSCSLEEMPERVVGHASIEDSLIRKETRIELLQALGQLSDREQNIVALKFWSGLTNRQIAELTGLSESHVGVLLYRAMKRLRNILVGEGGEEK
ncbi:MAG: sigma-70 family RNA polymerase sigma factor [Candidatus Atribacteria bacterium]|nr:sigma-70 family RNA polymerase sigma factor [Candidatus Atribacteria bacterium]